MTREQLAAFGYEAEKVLKAHFSGRLNVTYGGGTFDDQKGTLKFRMESGDKAEVEAGHRKHWDRYCSMYGLTPQHFGYEFKHRNENYKVCGLETTRNRYPIRAVCTSEGPKKGKEVVFTQTVFVGMQPVRSVA